MHTVSCVYLNSLIGVFTKLGMPRERLESFVDGGAGALKNINTRFPVENLLRVVNESVRTTGDQALGLKAGMSLRPDSLDDLGYAITFCDNLREAVAIHREYQYLNQDMARSRTDILPDVAHITWLPNYTEIEPYRYYVDLVFSAYATVGRWLVWREDEPNWRLQVRHSAPNDVSIHKMIFGNDVEFDSHIDRLSFSPEIMDIPLPSRNAEVKELLLSRLETQFANMGRPHSLTYQARRCIVSSLPKGRPNAAGIAKMLGQSERTFRRKLDSEGTSFRVLLEDAYKEVCEIHLRNQSQSHAQIALALGFSDQSAYTRAFRRWFGVAPKTYRARIIKGQMGTAAF